MAFSGKKIGINSIENSSHEKCTTHAIRVCVEYIAKIKSQLLTTGRALMTIMGALWECEGAHTHVVAANRWAEGSLWSTTGCALRQHLTRESFAVGLETLSCKVISNINKVEGKMRWKTGADIVGASASVPAIRWRQASARMATTQLQKALASRLSGQSQRQSNSDPKH